MNCYEGIRGFSVWIRISYSIDRFFDQQRGNLQSEPASGMAVGSEHSFHFVFFVDGRYRGFGVLVAPLFGAHCANVDSAQAGAKAFELFK